MSDAFWIQLGSGASYDYATGRLEGPFSPGHLADCLAALPRFLGQTSEPWNVAQHSLAVSATVEAVTGNPVAALGALLHDAHEALVGDIPTPLGRYIGPEVARIKQLAQEAIESALDVPLSARAGRSVVVHEAVKEADLAALYAERDAFLPDCGRRWALAPAERLYLNAARAAVRGLRGAEDPAGEWLRAYFRLTGD